MDDRKDIDVKAAKARLKKMRVEVEQLAEAHEHDRDPVVLDQTTQGRLSRMDAMQVQAMAEEVARRREVEIKRIDAGLKRIEEGEYGYCVSCGDEIAVKRLELDPTAPNCIACASGGA